MARQIKESEIKSLEDTRRDILDFSNACMNKRKHTQEQFRFILKRCDEYEKYIEKNHLKNGEIKNAIEEIRRLHKKCLQDNTFLKEGEGDVFVSAGNSGALLTGATLLVGRIKGIDRPALAGILPSYKSRLMLIDCGSNTNCKPINLLQFAQIHLFQKGKKFQIFMTMIKRIKV